MLIKKKEYDDLAEKANDKIIEIIIGKYEWVNRCLVIKPFEIESTIDLSEGVKEQILRLIKIVDNKYNSVIDEIVKVRLSREADKMLKQERESIKADIKHNLLQELNKCSLFNVFGKMKNKIEEL